MDLLIPAVRSLRELKRDTAGFSLEELIARRDVCIADGHLWRPLNAPQLTAAGAEWCGWCLRVRTRTIEAWVGVV